MIENEKSEELLALLKWKYDAFDDPEKARKLAPTEVYTRIVGYYRPVENWNPGKSEEYKDRMEFDLGTACQIDEEECESCQ